MLLIFLHAMRNRALHLLALILRRLLTNCGPSNASKDIAFQRIINRIRIIFLALRILKPSVCFILMLLNLDLLSLLGRLLLTIQVEQPVIRCLFDICVRDDVYVV